VLMMAWGVLLANLTRVLLWLLRGGGGAAEGTAAAGRGGGFESASERSFCSCTIVT
jgi:hypothetical protein